ncbi:c6 zinc finger domain-containing protein [Dactylonectria macrodidyma]|uniref:C6 zinc finger domain-containing protein n=1 Tax=Dactylonectria macrodidyma TaxID=307937 RepID=A0A9P9DEE9_9HYPO|nr:c6 zinc finger domain-containing protein [Dactylonectria macrodidyma]
MAGDDQQDGDGQSFSSMKRRRTALACDACRTRKSRCNGARPKCALCRRMGFECIYEIPNSSSNLIISKDIITNLRSRLRLLEQLVMRHDMVIGNVAINELGATSTSPQPDADIEDNTSLNHGRVILDVQPQMPDKEPETDEPDGMAVSIVDEHDHGYFGPSSNISLMRTIFQAVARRGHVPDSLIKFPSTGTSHTMATSRPTQTVPGNPAGTADTKSHSYLPPDHETEKLIRHFFSTTGILFPYIHEPSFLETYEHLKQHNFRVRVRRTWLALLNIILAMATCEGSQGDAEGSAAIKSGIFYRRAQELGGEQLLRGTTLETVQYLLLTSQYLQGTQKAVQTWITHGLAVKAALSIGLHSQQACVSRSPIEQEMRKRTWYGCVLLDRTLSMTYGRPSTVPEDYIHMDLPVSITGNAGEARSVAFFNATIKLYKILWKIMGGLYGHNLGCGELSTVDMITRILQLQQELNEWRPTLAPASPNQISGRYGHFHTVSRALRPMQENLVQSCTQSAAEVISLIHSVLTQERLGKGFLGAWWFTIYYTFNAGLVVFGSLLGPQFERDRGLAGTRNLEKGKRLLGKAIEALNRLGDGNTLIDRCVAYLERLSQLVEEWTISLAMSNTITCHAPQMNQTAATSGSETSGPMMGLPLFGNDSAFDEELELCPLVNNEFQRWFASTSWQNE